MTRQGALKAAFEVLRTCAARVGAKARWYSEVASKPLLGNGVGCAHQPQALVTASLHAAARHKKPLSQKLRIRRIILSLPPFNAFSRLQTAYFAPRPLRLARLYGPLMPQTVLPPWFWPYRPPGRVAGRPEPAFRQP